MIIVWSSCHLRGQLPTEYNIHLSTNLVGHYHLEVLQTAYSAAEHYEEPGLPTEQLELVHQRDEACM